MQSLHLLAHMRVKIQPPVMVHLPAMKVHPAVMKIHPGMKILPADLSQEDGIWVR